MYLSKVTIENFRCFGEGDDRFVLTLTQGLTALVGENEAGKTAVIDALRLALGTTDQEWYRLDDCDFHETRKSAKEESENNHNTRNQKEGGATVIIVCKFEGLNARDKRTFVEYLTYGERDDDKPVLYINWTATDTGQQYKGRPYRRVEVHSGKDGNGPSVAPEARELLRATYLRPLRDADQALSAGRGSRLSQILQNTLQVTRTGHKYDPGIAYDQEKLKELNILGIGDLANALLKQHKGVIAARGKVDEYLKSLSFHADDLKSNIEVSGADAKEEVRLRQLLEKLDLNLDVLGNAGLGSNNLLFIACELLLVAGENEGNKMLLVEEPEAHIHAQRQLQVMQFMEQQAKEKNIQIIITTHSPNLASAIDLNNIVMIRNGRAFSMAEGQTELEPSDYRFLERFLDVTKANLFFARGVMIVEGDAENILIPTLASLIERDFTEHGVSIVNVGGTGLHRYAKIFRRKGVADDDRNRQLDVPVACVTDMDVMPNCAPVIIGSVKEGDDWPQINKRRWRAKKDIGDEKALQDHREKKRAKAAGQYVKTFVSDQWTLEYDLSLGPKGENGVFPGGLAEDVFIAACLADDDDAINAGTKEIANVEQAAIAKFASLKGATEAKDGCTTEEVLASSVCAKFVNARLQGRRGSILGRSAIKQMRRR